VPLAVQLKNGAAWKAAKTSFATIAAGGAFAAKYKPAKKGTYRLRATLPASAAYTAAASKWLTFKVK
jgi:hypothetical protein